MPTTVKITRTTGLNRYLRDDRLKPRPVWEQVKDSIVFSKNGYLLFDDTVADKNYSHSIEPVRRQYSGNAHAVIKGIGIVTRVYVNPGTNQFWLINYRLFAPPKAWTAKRALDHVREMFDNAIEHKKLPFRAVLMDSRDAAKELMRHIERSGKIYYCLLKSNRARGRRLWRNGKTTVSARGFSGVDGNGT